MRRQFKGLQLSPEGPLGCLGAPVGMAGPHGPRGPPPWGVGPRGDQGTHWLHIACGGQRAGRWMLQRFSELTEGVFEIPTKIIEISLSNELVGYFFLTTIR